MTGMSGYYITRALISVALGALLALAGLPWWGALLTSVGTFAFFLWVPSSGRYVVHPELGATAMRHDERTKAIRDRAARNAFIVTMLAVAGVTVYFGLIAPADVPTTILSLILALGTLTYFVSDFLLRRS